jgi:peptide/nickel transport system ATP-binding protein
MYCGMVLEYGPTERVMQAPLSPYTQGLVACVRPGPGTIPFIPGRVPDPGTVGNGCPFADRCGLATARCRQESPQPRAAAGGHLVACHHAELP